MIPISLRSLAHLVPTAYLLFASCANGDSGTNAYRWGDGKHVVQDGTVNLVGFEGSIFYVVNYLPVCGSFSAPRARIAQIDLSEKCTFAMSSYNETDKTAGIYDRLGIELEDPPETVIAGGEEVCICGSFSQGQDTKADMCYWVDGSGFLETWWSLHTEHRTASSYQPSSQNKALPACKDVDLDKLVEESKATRDASPPEEEPEEDAGEDNETTSPSGSQTSDDVSDSSNSPTQSSSAKNSPNATNTAPPAESGKSIGDTAKIWAPVLAAVCSILFGAIGLWYKRNESKKKHAEGSHGKA